MHRREDDLTTPDEGILEAALEELLSGQRPPDQSARIMQRLALRQASQAANVQLHVQNGSLAGHVPTAPVSSVGPPLAQPPLAAPMALPAAPPVQVAASGVELRDPPGHLGAASRNRRYGAEVERRRWLGIAVAAGVAAVGLGVGLLVLNYSRSQVGSDTVAKETVAIEEGANNSIGETASLRGAGRGSAAPQAVARVENPFHEEPFGAEDLASATEPGVPWPLPYAVEPQPADKVIEFIDGQLASAWEDSGITPTPAADDDQWCRRVFQQILGRQPESNELVDFATSTAQRKRESLVHKLLYGEQYQDELAQHWARVWTTTLLGPDVREIAASREGLEKYLYDALRSGKQHDEIAKDLLAATGSSRPGDPDFNGAVNFVLAGVDGDKAKLTADVSRVFLAHQGQCAQCHDQPGGRSLSQEQFWQLAAFFQQATAQRDEATKTLRLVNRDFPGATGNAAEAELFYERPDRQRKIAYPVFLDGSRISASGRVADVDRRAELASKITRSEPFAQASVDQVWSRLLGRGLVEPAFLPAGQTGRDAPRDARGGLKAELLLGLGEQFAAHQFNHKRLIEWIVLSDANARTWAVSSMSDEKASHDELFAQSYRPDDPPAPLYDTVAVAIEDTRRHGRPVTGEEMTYLGRVAAGQPGEAGSIFVRSRTPTSSGLLRPARHGDPFVQRMISSDMTFTDKVEHLFLHALARRPTRDELASLQETLAAQGGSIAGTLDELWWAIQNSREYVTR
jgi:hypothetical protein